MARPFEAPRPPAAEPLLLGGRTRLAWLIRLRWWALAGVSLAALVAWAGLVPGVNLPLVVAAVLLGLLTNLGLARRSRQNAHLDERHVRQALLDTGALTLVLWAAGGIDCPFVGFYAFPVLLAALLGDRPALLPAGVATAAGLGFLASGRLYPALAVGRWNPPERFADALNGGAVALTIAGVAYFALVFSEAIRSQARARRDADMLLRLSLEGLDVGLEVIEADDVVWQNPEATALLGARRGAPWRCPRGPDACRADACARGPAPSSAGESRRRCQFPLRTGPGERLFEMLVFPLAEPGRARIMVLYLDRTTEILAQRHLVLTERLASLGRTVQGVAHELNTPLSTIRTLARDLTDVLAAGGPATSHDRADLLESGTLIASEVERCRRITHALLGRAEPQAGVPGTAGLGEAVARAVAVVFPLDRDRVALSMEAAAGARPVALDPTVQVLVNLLQNARDAAAGGPVRVGAAVSGDALTVTVEDDGPGLSPEAAAHLFEPFFTTKPPGQGTGLGLYTSYALAGGMGGRVSLENRAAGGVTARLVLPAGGNLSDPSSAAPASR
jgi:signal transduction histidine kinase